MANATFLSKKPEDTEKLGHILSGLLQSGSMVVLSGSLGSGKTVFVRGMAAGLNIRASIVSPSYTIAAVYEGDLPLTHVDLYRTGSDEELELLGFDELTSKSGITAVEWGEKAATFLDETAIKVYITINSADERCITISNITVEQKRSIEREFAGIGL